MLRCLSKAARGYVKSDETVETLAAFLVAQRLSRLNLPAQYRHSQRSEEQLTVDRAEAVKYYGVPLDGTFTCDSCAARDVCTGAFDWYNTDGDCLMEK